MRFLVLAIVGVTVFIMARAIRSGIRANEFHRRKHGSGSGSPGDGPVELSVGNDGDDSGGNDGD